MKIVSIQKALNEQYAERNDVIEGLLLAMVARQHALLIGPPGTGKSALVSDLSSRITGANYFQWLLTRFSTPEELFGPVSLKELETGVYNRNTDGKLPEAHTVFLDELFKSNSAILNSLLTLINERIFYNNGGPIQTPLISVIGSSNEYPEADEGLEALFDRFLIRFEVDYIGEEQSFISMMKGSSHHPATMTLDELYELQFFSDMVTIPNEVYESLAKIRNELKDEGIQPSDRRFKQSISVIKARAALAGRQVAVVEDIIFLKNSLWETPDQKQMVAEIVEKHASDVVSTTIKRIHEDINSIVSASDNSTEVIMESIEKMKRLSAEVRDLTGKYPARKELGKTMELIQKSLEEFTSEAVGI